jgi:hypothetical protein
MEHGAIGSFAIAMFVLYLIARGRVRHRRWQREDEQRSQRA